MKFSDIKPRHIYSVWFNPVQKSEFDGSHLALVLKKNSDKRTCVVMPLTSQSNGVGATKTLVGTIPTLPPNLSVNPTYAVYNQVRTLNHNRFNTLKDDTGNVQEAKIDDNIFYELLDYAMKDMSYDLSLDEKLELSKKRYEKSCVSKVIDLAYTVLGLKKSSTDTSGDVERLKTEIKGIMINVGKPYVMEQQHIDNGIDKLLDEIMENE